MMETSPRLSAHARAFRAARTTELIEVIIIIWSTWLTSTIFPDSQVSLTSPADGLRFAGLVVDRGMHVVVVAISKRRPARCRAGALMRQNAAPRAKMAGRFWFEQR